MKELKAGIYPPPQPRELQSRDAALISRAPNVPPHISENFHRRLNALALSTTERFRTGYEGVLLATQRELADTTWTLPKEKLSDSTTQQITVAIASNNDRKVADLIRVVSLHADIINIPDAKEDHTRNSQHDALSKAKSAAEILAQSEEETRRNVRNRPHLTIATDVVNKRLVTSMHPETGLAYTTYEPLGKPSNLRDVHGNELTHKRQEKSVQEMFGQLSEMAEVGNWKAIPYTIEMSTVMYNPQDPDNLALSTQKATVFLSRDGVTYLSTDDGFIAYKNAVTEAGFDITQTAGGFELGVLQKMGFVKHIIEEPSPIADSYTNSESEDAAYRRAYALAVGNVDASLVAEYFKPLSFPEDTIFPMSEIHRENPNPSFPLVQ